MLTRKPRLLRSRRVRFNNKAMASSYDAAEPGKTSKDIVDAELTSAFCSIRIPTAPMVPDLFTNLPLVRDALETPTLALQNQTVEECLPFLSGEGQLFEKNENGVPRLLRESHARFLRTSLGRLPGRFVAADASRPWFLYWCLSGLTLLGQDVSCYRQSLAETVRSLQNLPGGFGGGSGQLSHLATTYAVVLSLALVGGEDCFEVVDRRALWKWLCSLKQPDGGFQVCLGGEEDIRYVSSTYSNNIIWHPELTGSFQGRLLRGSNHQTTRTSVELEYGVASVDRGPSQPIHRRARICPQV